MNANITQRNDKNLKFKATRLVAGTGTFFFRIPDSRVEPGRHLSLVLQEDNKQTGDVSSKEGQHASDRVRPAPVPAPGGKGRAAAPGGLGQEVPVPVREQRVSLGRGGEIGEEGKPPLLICWDLGILSVQGARRPVRRLLPLVRPGPVGVRAGGRQERTEAQIRQDVRKVQVQETKQTNKQKNVGNAGKR